MRIEQDTKLDFQDVLLRPKRSTIVSRKDVELHRSFTFKYSSFMWMGIPIISSNMSSVTNEKVAGIMASRGMLACMPKTNPIAVYNTIPSFGMKALENPKVATASMVCLDVANGYIEAFVKLVEEVRAWNKLGIIIAGNVVTPEMTEALILAGADVVKVGIGSGSACATRLKTGVGYPQLSAVMECADAAHGLGGHVVSDGGCTNPGDVAKAFAAGADFVMLGGMLAGHEENGTEFYGMSSKKANEEFAGGLKDYKAAEGHEMQLPSRGKLADTLQDINGGLRSTCAYVGAKSLKDLPKCATFVRVNRLVNESLLEYRR